MAMLKWDEEGKKIYETGTSKGVLFPNGKTGVAWNGLISVKQAPDGAESTKIYANNSSYGSLTSAENFKGTINAYTYPEEFAVCDGSKSPAAGVYVGQQTREPFGLVYATIVANDTKGADYGETLHFIYNAKVAPSAKEYQTINESPEAISLSWSFDTTAIDTEIVGFKPTAYIAVKTAEVDATKLKALTDLIYGSASTEPKMPTPKELLALLKK